MKTYIEVEEKQREYQEKFDKLQEENPNDIKTLCIYGDWVDLIGELLIWNVSKYAEKVGYDFNSEEEIFEFTDEVKKELLITEDEAREMLEQYEKEVNSYMFSKKDERTQSMLKTEVDILRWMLENN